MMFVKNEEGININTARAFQVIFMWKTQSIPSLQQTGFFFFDSVYGMWAVLLIIINYFWVYLALQGSPAWLIWLNDYE